MIWICCSFFCSQRSLGSSFRLNDVIPAHWLSRWINPSINLVEISLSRCPKRSSSLVTCGFLFSSFGACVCVCVCRHCPFSSQLTIDNEGVRSRSMSFHYAVGNIVLEGIFCCCLFIYTFSKTSTENSLTMAETVQQTAWCDRWNFRSLMSVLVVRFVARKKNGEKAKSLEVLSNVKSCALHTDTFSCPLGGGFFFGSIPLLSQRENVSAKTSFTHSAYCLSAFQPFLIKCYGMVSQQSRSKRFP